MISTLDEEALGSPLPGAYESEYPLRPCNYDAFDTRVMLHAANAVSRGYKRILIFANDTDIIVIGISFFNAIGADKLWVLFCHVLDTYIRPEVVSQPLLLNQNTRTAYVTSARCRNTSQFPHAFQVSLDAGHCRYLLISSQFPYRFFVLT